MRYAEGSAPIDPQLERILQHLYALGPLKAIIQHGSRVRGDAALHSDYDLLVLCNEPDLFRPHRFEDCLLDLDGMGCDYLVIETSGVPIWPLHLLYDDADGLGAALIERTRQKFEQGPPVQTVDAWKNHAQYVERLIARLSARGHDPAVARYYLSDLYMRAVRYWFEKHNKWTVSSFRALPVIAAEDPAYFALLQGLWGDEPLGAARSIQEALFFSLSNIEKD